MAKSEIKSLVLGGILPIVIYTLVEEYYGILWGLVAGMVFGIGEILTEYIRDRKVSGITLFGNGMLISLGLVSLFTNEGFWFKMQPAILEFGMALVFMGSVILKKPVLVMLGHKQGIFLKMPEEIRPRIEKFFNGMTFRIGIFFLFHSVLASWAALHWSTRSWALLKGVWFNVSMVVYMLIEVGVIRYLLRRKTSA